MSRRPRNHESLSERQFKSGVFDVDYAALDGGNMSHENRKLTALEKERQMRDEEKSSRQSRTSRLKSEMNQDNGDGKRAYSTKFGTFSGAGTVDPSDIKGSDASVKVTAEQKREFKRAGIDVDHLDDGEEIPLAGLQWDKPEGE